MVQCASAGPDAALRRGLAEDGHQDLDLPASLGWRSVTKVDRIDAHEAESGIDHRFQGGSLQGQLVDHAVLGQQVIAARQDRRAAEQHVAELAPPVDESTVRIV